MYIKAKVAKAAGWYLVPLCVPPHRPSAVATLCFALQKLHLQVICRKICLGDLYQGTPGSAVPENANEFGTHIGKSTKH